MLKSAKKPKPVWERCVGRLCCQVAQHECGLKAVWLESTKKPKSAKKPPVFPGLKRQLSIPKLTELGKDASVASDKAMVKKMSEDNLSALNAEPEVKRIVA